MPAKSKKQFKFMEMLANNPEIAKEHDMSPEQAKEYVSHNTGSKSYSNLPEKKTKAKMAALKKLAGK